MIPLSSKDFKSKKWQMLQNAFAALLSDGKAKPFPNYLFTYLFSQDMLDYAHLSQALGMATPRTLRRRLRSTLRGRKLVDVRMAIAQVLHERGYTYEEIARELNRAQSLIHHYVKTHEAVVETDAAYRQMVELVRRVIGDQQGVAV